MTSAENVASGGGQQGAGAVNIVTGGPSAEGEPDRREGAVIVVTHGAQHRGWFGGAGVAGRTGGGGHVRYGLEQLVSAQASDGNVQRVRKPPLGVAVELDSGGNILDQVLVEGYKTHPFPKLEVHRPALGKPPIWPEQADIVAVASDADVVTGRTTLPLNDPAAIAGWLRAFAIGTSASCAL